MPDVRCPLSVRCLHLLRAICLTLLLVAISLCRSGLAQADDDELQAVDTRPGLVAHFVTNDGERITRVVDRVVLSDAHLPLDDRLARGIRTVRYEGQLYVEFPETFVIAAHVRGRLIVQIDGQSVIDVDHNGAEATWAESASLELDFGHHALVIEYTPPADGPELTLAWSASYFTTETIAPRWLSHTEPSDEYLHQDQGRQLTRVLRCGACHNVPLVAAPLATPSLDHVAGNIEPAWLVDWLSSDRQSDRTGNRTMPHFDFTPSQARDVAAALLESAADESSDTPGGTEGDVSRAEGERMFVSLGCAACHRVGEVGRRELFGGSDLTQIAEKRPEGFFRRWLSDPAAINANHRMPQFKLSDDELDVLTEFLASCREADGHETTETVDNAVANASPERGRALVAERRCTACHTSRPTAVDAVAKIPVERWGRGCLASDERGNPLRPRYELTGTETDAVVDYLAAHPAGQPTEAAAAHAGALVLEQSNCQACHRRDGRGGLAELMKEITVDAAHLVDLTPVMRPPALDGVGEKFNAQTLREVIAQPPVRRPWLRTRMPSFAFDDATLAAVADHLVAADRTPAYPGQHIDRAAEIDEAALAAAGQRLVTSDGFGCTSCHRIGKQKPGEKRPEALGPDLSMLGDRVRRAWFDRFVREPTRLVSGLEMPSIMAPVGGVLGDDIGDQLDAVWHVLNQPGFQPPKPGALRIVRQTGRRDDAERPSVITDVLRAGGRTVVKPLLVGLPNRHNVLVDLESGGLTDWWLGDVAEQRTEGKSWYWQARGEPLLANAPGVDVQIVRGGETIEPLHEGQFQIEYDSLEYLGDGVRYSYRLFFPDAAGEGRECVHVAETISSVWSTAGTSGGFRRLVEIVGTPAADRVRLTVAQNLEMSATLVDPSLRRLTLAGDDALTVEIVAPTSARFVQADRLQIDVPADEADRIEVVYRSRSVADQFAPSAAPIDGLAAEPITTVPGFEGARLGLPREIMPVALAWRDDGALLVGTLKGRVWLARDTDGDALEDTATVFCDGLAAPYGLAAGDGYVDVINKYALLRLYDDDDDDGDGDGVADRIVRLTSGWGHTVDYHDWAVGLPRDGDGGYYVAFPCQQDDRSLPAATLRGAVVRLVPREPTAADPGMFAIDPLSHGHRFPMGIARNRRGELFVTDNQGNYNPFNELNHVVRGARFGFINKLERASDFRPELTPPTLDIPHPWTRSVNGICFLEVPRLSKNNEAAAAADTLAFGPFAGHLVGCEYDTRRLIRMSLDRVGDTMQGAAYPLSTSDRATADNFIGPIICATAPNGDLYVGSIRDSGWGGGNNVGDIVRLRLTADGVPAGIREVRATADGFQIDFTRAIDTTLAGDVASYTVSSYRRVSTPQYGGDDVDRRTDIVRSTTVDDDALGVRLVVDDLREGYLYELRLRNLAGEDTMFYPAEAYYTLRRIPADR